MNINKMCKAEAMKLDASLPKSWWEFSIEMAVHIYNRTLLRHTEYKMPIENLNGSKPDISYFKVFGCEAWVYISKERHQNKLSPKSEVMTFIGYDSLTMGYKFMTRENKLFISSHALFIESRYPRAKREVELTTKDKHPLEIQEPKESYRPDSSSNHKKKRTLLDNGQQSDSSEHHSDGIDLPWWNPSIRGDDDFSEDKKSSRHSSPSPLPSPKKDKGKGKQKDEYNPFRHKRDDESGSESEPSLTSLGSIRSL